MDKWPFWIPNHGSFDRVWSWTWFKSFKNSSGLHNNLFVLQVGTNVTHDMFINLTKDHQLKRSDTTRIKNLNLFAKPHSCLVMRQQKSRKRMRMAGGRNGAVYYLAAPSWVLLRGYYHLPANSCPAAHLSTTQFPPPTLVKLLSFGNGVQKTALHCSSFITCTLTIPR